MPKAAKELFQSHPLASSVDIDEARQVLSDVYLPLDFPSASASTEVDLRLNVVTVGRITAGYLRLGGAIRIHTSEATDYHIDIPLTGKARMRSGTSEGFYGTPASAGVFMPGYTAELDCDAEFSQIAVMIPRTELQLELENLLGYSATEPLVFHPKLDVASGPGSTVLQVLHLIDQVADESPAMLGNPLASQHLEQVLIDSLLLSQPHNYSTALAPPVASAGPRPVGRAVELLRAHAEYAWTVAELAEGVGVSVRSLQEGFRRSMRSTPMAYLRDLRLERINQELATSDPGIVSVTEVAAKWGITHFGRFAASYQRKFSEKPSDTIRRASISSI